MRFSSILTIAPFFAVTLAAPFTYKLGTGGSEANVNIVKQAIIQANELIDKMQDASASDIARAFGVHVDQAEVKECLAKLKSGRIFFDDAENHDSEGVRLAGTLKNKHVVFGSSFFSHQTDSFRAGTLVHEASHSLCGTYDWFDKQTCQPVTTTKDAYNGYTDSSDFKTLQANCGKSMHLNADSYRLLSGATK